DRDGSSFEELHAKIRVVNPVKFLKRSLGSRCPSSFDLVKIDTQGADFEILEACLPFLSRNSIVVSEYSPYHLHRNGTSKGDVARLALLFNQIEIIRRPYAGIRTSPLAMDQLLIGYDNNYLEWNDYSDLVFSGYKG